MDPPAGSIFYIECKKPGQKPRPSQEAYHAKLRRKGRIVIVAHDLWSLQHEIEQAGIVLSWKTARAEALR